MTAEGLPTAVAPAVGGDDGSAIEFALFFRGLLRRWWIVVLVVLLAGGGAYAAARRETPVYQSSTSILILPSLTESSYIAQGIDPTRLLADEIQIMGGSQVKSLVAKRLGFSASVTASASSSDDIIVVTARDSSPNRASEIANVYADSFISFLASTSATRTSQAQQSLTSQIDSIQQQLDQLDQVLANTPAAQQGSVESAQANQRASLNATLANDQTQLVTGAGTTSQSGAQILVPAAVPSTPISPHPTHTAAEGLAVGIVLGIGVALLVDFLDNRIHGQEDLGRLIRGVPVLGLIPPTPGWRDGRVARVISVEDPAADVSEAYRRLRTSIQFLAVDRSLKTIQVTSPWKSEGKTTTAVNLAVALARSGQRVIVVDCDLRRPRIAEFFHLNSRVGFTSVLLGDTPLSRALLPAESVEGLRILPAGPIPPNPSELLAGKRTGEILDRLAADADFLVLDSPPVLPVSDAAVIASRVDGVIVVVNDNSTSRKQLQRAMELLSQVGSTVAGLVLNRTRQDEASYQYEYGYSYRAGKAARTKPSRRADRRWVARDSGSPRKQGAGDAEPPAPDGAGRSSSGASGERRVKKPGNVATPPEDVGAPARRDR